MLHTLRVTNFVFFIKGVSLKVIESKLFKKLQKISSSRCNQLNIETVVIRKALFLKTKVLWIQYKNMKIYAREHKRYTPYRHIERQISPSLLSLKVWDVVNYISLDWVLKGNKQLLYSDKPKKIFEMSSRFKA